MFAYIGYKSNWFLTAHLVLQHKRLIHKRSIHNHDECGSQLLVANQLKENP